MQVTDEINLLWLQRFIMCVWGWVSGGGGAKNAWMLSCGGKDWKKKQKKLRKHMNGNVNANQLKGG